MVTSDSLAAESVQEGGSFAANSDARGPMSQPSYSTNTNTTDVSNATRLEPAPDAEARGATEEWNEAAQLNAGGKLTGGTTKPTSTEPGESVSMPKGKDITEGGFDPNAPNASYNTAIGSKKDPGRAALGKFEAENVPVAGAAGERQQEISKDGQFDVLKDASA